MRSIVVAVALLFGCEARVHVSSTPNPPPKPKLVEITAAEAKAIYDAERLKASAVEEQKHREAIQEALDYAVPEILADIRRLSADGWSGIMMGPPRGDKDTIVRELQRRGFEARMEPKGRLVVKWAEADDTHVIDTERPKQ